MRSILFIIGVTLLLSGCSLFKTPEPDLFRVATLEVSGVEFGEPFGIAHRKDHLYVSDGDAGKIFRISGSGDATVYAEGLGTPSHLAFDDDGYLLVADSGTHTIKRIRAGGDVEVIAGVEGRAGFSDGATSEALFHAPVGLAVMNGDIYVADTYNDRIRVIRNGQVTTVAGGPRGFIDGSVSDARFDTPTGIIVTKDKRILVADTGNRRVRAIAADGVVTTVADSELEEPSAFAVSEQGDIFFTDGDSIKRLRRQDGTVETLTETERGYSDSAQSEPRRFNRPTGLTIGSDGALYVADSDNRAIRVFSKRTGKVLSQEDLRARAESPEAFKAAAPGRWPYEIPDATRDIAGTFGEIRGAVDAPDDGIYFHNGLDIAGSYGERAYFVRTEKVLRPVAAANFGTLREYLRMPTLGYVHLRLGRDQDDKPFVDPRFVFDLNGEEVTDVRVPRGSVFNAGEVVGTLNAMNHVHLVVGRRGYELNGLAALDLPGVADMIAPTINDVWLEDSGGKRLSKAIETGTKPRLVVDAHDRMDGNPERRRLGIYRAGFVVTSNGIEPPSIPAEWSITFDALPGDDSVPLIYAGSSVSGPSGGTVFRYLVTNRLRGASVSEGVLDTGTLVTGTHRLRVYVADYFGNTSFKDLDFEIK